jgi:hypothetical protein
LSVSEPLRALNNELLSNLGMGRQRKAVSHIVNKTACCILLSTFVQLVRSG